MSIEIIFLYSVISLIFILVLLCLIRIVKHYYGGKRLDERKDESKVGFVVDTFHEMVSTLKDFVQTPHPEEK